MRPYNFGMSQFISTQRFTSGLVIFLSFFILGVNSAQLLAEGLEKKAAQKVEISSATQNMTQNKSQDKTLWVDVRSDIEHRLDSIQGDIHAPHQHILEKITEAYPDKDTPINLYCLSGGRSSRAQKILQEAGYTAVKNVGGINDVRRMRKLSN